MNTEIELPKDIVDGSECLYLGVPWQTPESIYKEADSLSKEDVVLEVGSGGSTIFFTRRCKYVTSIETKFEWMQKVSASLVSKEQTGNLFYIYMPEEDGICEVIRDMDTSNVTVFSVDTEGNYNRSKILNEFLSKGVSAALRMLIVDNYAHEGLFPDHWDKDNFMGDGWEVFTFTHDRWAGAGTRLYIKKQQC